MKKLHRITLTQGYGSEQVKLISYVWTNDSAAVHNDLLSLVELNTDIEIEPLKWWQWK